MTAIARFGDFDRCNDPYREHDCAIVAVDGTEVIWKISYLDPFLEGASDDAADPRRTVRILTIMLTAECRPGVDNAPAVA